MKFPIIFPDKRELTAETGSIRTATSASQAPVLAKAAAEAQKAR
jgi:hypothetical protein